MVPSAESPDQQAATMRGLWSVVFMRAHIGHIAIYESSADCLLLINTRYEVYLYS